MRFGHSEDSDSSTKRAKNFNGVAGFRAWPWRGVIINDSCNVAPADSFVGNVFRKCHATEEWEFHTSGYSVINLVNPVAFSSIQTD